jgi:type II secretory pathway pseudopilin PulG
MKNKNYLRGKRSSKGFSMIELLFAAGVLAVAVVGGMTMVLLGMARNGSNRMDTTATNVAQSVLEDIAGTNPSANPAPVLTVTDCRANNLQVTTAVGGSALKANGSIDFSQPVVAGYQVNYTACGNNGLAVTYDVRWRVDPVAGTTWGKLVTVAARQPLAVRQGTIFYSPPVTLRTIVGM